MRRSDQKDIQIRLLSEKVEVLENRLKQKNYNTVIENDEKESVEEKSQETDISSRVKCEECSFIAKNETGLKVHKKAKHTQESFDCQKCNSTFDDITNLNIHMEDDHTNFACKHCDFTCET